MYKRSIYKCGEYKMKARTVHYRRRLKNIFKNLKQIKWIQEIVKAFVIFCLSVTILFLLENIQ